MKRVFSTMLTLAAVLLLLPSIVPAQVQLETEKGLMVGLNFANFKGADSDGSKTKTGIVGGGFVRFNLSPSVAIQPELLYSMKGAKGTEFGIDFEFKLAYLEVPVLLRFTIPTEGNVVPALFAGPAVGFNISSKFQADAQGISGEVDIDNARSVDFGLVLGGAVTVGSGNAKFFIDARYNLGLTNAYEDVDSPGLFDLVDLAGNAPELKNSGFLIMVGVTF